MFKNNAKSFPVKNLYLVFRVSNPPSIYILELSNSSKLVVIYVVICVVPCIVCVYMCTVILPPGDNPNAVNKHIIYHMIL